MTLATLRVPCWLSLGRYVRKVSTGRVLAPVRVKMTAGGWFRELGPSRVKVEHVFAACQTDGEGENP